MNGGGIATAPARDPLRFAFEGAEVVPRYFLERDHLWLRSLLDEYVRYEGKPRRELVERLAEPLPTPAPADKLRIARQVLDRIWSFETRADVAPRRIRAVLFGAASGALDREAALARATAELGIDESAVMAGLFADLPYERLVTGPENIPGVAMLAQQGNLALVSNLLKRALAVSIRGDSDLRVVVRQAKLKGLLCTVRQRCERGGRDRLEISGPYALFRRTTLYGRALATLVPFAAHCQDMELRAACLLEGEERPRPLVIRSGDPLFPAPVSKRHDSKLEERFFRDFTREAPDWDVIREPAAVPVDDTLIFPDFELRHRRDPSRRWTLEIAGFWTAGYVTTKLQRLRKAALSQFILCLDEERDCAQEELPRTAQVIRYRRRIEPADVLAIIDPQ